MLFEEQGCVMVLRNCKIITPNFNIKSALRAENVGDGAKNERIFKVCNHLISRCLRAIRRKIPPF